MPTYQLIFEGHIQEGRHPDEVRQNLADLFGVPTSEIESLFRTTPVVLKDGLDEQTARKDKDAFEQTGAVCRIEMELPATPHRDGDQESSPPTAATAETPSTAAQSDTSQQADQRRYDLWHPYLLSFYSKPFYRDVARHWRALAFIHLLILVALTSVVFILHFQAIATAFVNDQAPAILAQIPPIDIKQGEARVAVDQPYRIYRKDGRTLFAVIDTTGQTRSLRQSGAMLLLTRSRLMAQIGSGASRIIDLSPIDNLHLTRDDMAQWLQTSLRWAPVVLYPLMLFFTYCLRTVQILIYGAIGLVLASLMKSKISFGAAAAVAVMAMTPVILIDTLLMVFKIHIPLWNIVSFVVALAYLFFGIRSTIDTA